MTKVTRNALQDWTDVQAIAFRTSMDKDRLRMNDAVRRLNEEAFAQVEREVRRRDLLV